MARILDSVFQKTLVERKGMKLSASIMPPSNQGRKAIPVVQEYVDFFVENLRQNPIQELDDDFRPMAYGPEDHLFEKDSRAQAEGRRYAKAVNKALGATVRVNVYDNGAEGAAQRFLWRLYVPLSEGMELMDAPDAEEAEEATESDTESEALEALDEATGEGAIESDEYDGEE